MGTKNKPGKYDCYANAHPDEPMFVLLGRDPEAAALVEEWASRRFALEGRTEKVLEARACAEAMRQWHAAGAKKLVTIIVNGASVDVHLSELLTYEKVCMLAEMTGAPSMTWRTKDGMHAGTMAPGSFSIVPSEGLVFSVAHTGNGWRFEVAEWCERNGFATRARLTQSAAARVGEIASESNSEEKKT